MAKKECPYGMGSCSAHQPVFNQCVADALDGGDAFDCSYSSYFDCDTDVMASVLAGTKTPEEAENWLNSDD